LPYLWEMFAGVKALRICIGALKKRHSLGQPAVMVCVGRI
jgi:hypothetical protein